MGDEDVVAADWRDERIAELEAALARKDAELAVRDARIVELEGQVATLTSQMAALTKQVAELLEKLGRNSRNSHLPPSTDPPGTRGQSGKGAGGRKRGGQPGHGGSRRTLLPPQRVDEVVDLFPSHCEGCARELPEVQDLDAHRYQQVELPPIQPHTTEWRCHEVACARCGTRTRAPYDADLIPASPFGPRLMALMAFLTGVYHVSRRKTVVLLWEVLGVRIFARGAQRGRGPGQRRHHARRRGGVDAGRRGRGQAHRRHELVAGRRDARALDHRNQGGDGVQKSSPTTARQRSCRSTARFRGNPRERPGQGARLLGDE